MLDAAIYVLEVEQTVHVQRSETVSLHRAQVATAALHPHHFRLRTRQRIGSHDLAGGISAAIVGQPKVGTQQIGTIHQQTDLVALQAGSGLIIPQITDMLERAIRIRHDDNF